MISIVPIAKEKALNVSTMNQYMFQVPLGASKTLIAKNVEEQFNVTVTDVKTLVRKGKSVRFSRGKRRYPGTTYRKDMKIAYVTLKEGDKIKVFDEEMIDAAPKAEEKATEASVKVKAEDEAKTKKSPLFAKRRTGKRGDK